MFRSFLINVLILAALAGCGKKPATAPVVFPAECEILPRPAKPAGFLTVALLDAVDFERAPRAGNKSEELLFRRLYETLITVDCLGQVHPGLAESWIKGSGGSRWTFQLREGASFWGGTPLTARDVAESWLDFAVEPVTRNAGIDSTVVEDDRVLHVYLNRRYRDVPRIFSSSAFAATKPSDYTRWPLGSGFSRVVSVEEGVSRHSRRTITVQPVSGGSGPVIEFIETTPRNALDLLEETIDVMITGEPDVIEYATSRPQFVTHALPWDRTYVLLSTSRVGDLRGGRPVSDFPRQLTEGLARDAVRGDARGSQSPFWWEELEICGDFPEAAPVYPPGGGRAYPPARSFRFLYERNDPVARDLAERLVALAATDPDVSPGAAVVRSAMPGLAGDAAGAVAEGVAEGEMARSLWVGDDFAYVVSIPQRPPDPCQEARNLLNRAPWLFVPGVDLARAVVPLVDTRLHVIARRDRVGLAVDYCGNVLLSD